MQEGLRRGFGLEGHLQDLLPPPCSRQAASSHCPTSCSPPLGGDEMLFLSAQDSCSWGSMGRNVSHTRICMHHRLPSKPPWESPPPSNPLLIKKLKLLISSHINVDLRPRQSPDTSHNLCWLQTAGGVCWRTRMTSRCLPQTGVTQSAWFGRRPGAGGAQPHSHPHPTSTTPCPGPTRTGDGPENGSRH